MRFGQKMLLIGVGIILAGNGLGEVRGENSKIKGTKAEGTEAVKKEGTKAEGAEVVKQEIRSHEAGRQSSSQPAGENINPVITVDQAEHDFGQVWAGQKVTHEFKITNTGQGELQITKVRPGCGCTVAGDYPRSLKPGEAGTFPFTLNTRSFRSAFSKTITIESNDPVTPRLVLKLKGEIKARIELEPAEASFGAMYGPVSLTRVITLRNNTEQPMRLAVDPFASEGPFKFDLAEKVPGQLYEMTVTTKPPFEKPGLLRTKAVVLTNMEDQRQIEVGASLTVRDRLEVEPAELPIMPLTTRPAMAEAKCADNAQPSEKAGPANAVVASPPSEKVGHPEKAGRPSGVKTEESGTEKGDGAALAANTPASAIIASPPSEKASHPEKVGHPSGLKVPTGNEKGESAKERGDRATT